MYQYMCEGTKEQDVMLWNKGVTIQDLTKKLYCSYFLIPTYSIMTGYVWPTEQ